MIDNKKLTRASSAGLVLALLAGCGHAPIAKPAFEGMAEKRAGLPTDWTMASMTGDASAVLADYSVFGDAQLTSYIQESLENNRTIRASLESVRQSQAALKQVRSGLFPQVRAGVGVSSSSPVENFDLDGELYSFNLNAAYDVDIMGDLSASIQASSAGLRSTEATYELARRQLAAQVARAYFAVIEQQLQLDLDKRSLERARSTYKITETRSEAGAIARDELVLGQSSLASAEDSLLASESSLRSATRALEVLMGRFPKNQLSIAGALPTPPALPPLGLPELTIRSRPDVVAAEYNLIQTFANNRVTHLSRWPQLDANLGLAALNGPQGTTTDLFNLEDLAFTIGLSLAQTIFDGGAISGRIEASDAGKRAALERYGQTVIDAYAQIVNAIDAFSTLEARTRSIQTASEANLEVLRLGELRYNEGSQNLLDLIQFRERADAAESLLIANKRARLEQWIALHQALGGDPTKAIPLPTTTATTAEAKKK